MKYVVKSRHETPYIYVTEDFDKALAMFKLVCSNVPDEDICLVHIVVDWY